MCVCMCVYIQGRQPSILSAPMLSFLVSIPVLSRRRGGPDEECNFFWLAFPLEQLSCSCLQTNHCKMWKNVSDQTSRSSGGYGRNYARYIKADGLKLSLMIGGLSRLCYGRQIQKRFTQHYAETDVSSMSYHGSAPFFPFPVKKISYRAVMVNDPTPAV